MYWCTMVQWNPKCFWNWCIVLVSEIDIYDIFNIRIISHANQILYLPTLYTFLASFDDKNRNQAWSGWSWHLLALLKLYEWSSHLRRRVISPRCIESILIYVICKAMQYVLVHTLQEFFRSLYRSARQKLWGCFKSRLIKGTKAPVKKAAVQSCGGQIFRSCPSCATVFFILDQEHHAR